jgi:hypothetical protein
MPVYAAVPYQPQRPLYTCPRCREAVRNKPVEDFTLKALVQAVAEAEGESSPKKQLGNGGKGKGPAENREEPWDRFFRGIQK